MHLLLVGRQWKAHNNRFLIRSQERVTFSEAITVPGSISREAEREKLSVAWQSRYKSAQSCELLTLFSWFLLFWRSVMTQLWMKKASVRTPVSWGNRILNSKGGKKVLITYFFETNNAKMQRTYSAVEPTGRNMNLHVEMGQSILSLTIANADIWPGSTKCTKTMVTI